jgi:hypothetical protein
LVSYYPPKEVIGCVYIYPAKDDEHDAHVRSWVRADVAELDARLHASVSSWLADRWPFDRVRYADRAALPPSRQVALEQRSRSEPQ